MAGKQSNKDKQLGMSLGKAANKLRRKVMFHLLKKLDDVKCFRCGEVMTEEDFSIDHKEDWLGASTDLFWDTTNIAFSHKRCNTPRRYFVAVLESGQEVKICKKCGKFENEVPFSTRGFRFCIGCEKEYYRDIMRSRRAKRRGDSGHPEGGTPGTPDPS
jgi:hypothetical protein